jgi:hypothetical protein
MIKDGGYSFILSSLGKQGMPHVCQPPYSYPNPVLALLIFSFNFYFCLPPAKPKYQEL